MRHRDGVLEVVLEVDEVEGRRVLVDEDDFESSTRKPFFCGRVVRICGRRDASTLTPAEVVTICPGPAIPAFSRPNHLLSITVLAWNEGGTVDDVYEHHSSESGSTTTFTPLLEEGPRALPVVLWDEVSSFGCHRVWSLCTRFRCCR